MFPAKMSVWTGLMLLLATLVALGQAINFQYDLNTLRIEKNERNLDGFNYTSWNVDSVEMSSINLPIPLTIYGTNFTGLDVYTNGFIALQREGDVTKPSAGYPTLTSSPLTSQHGNFLSILSLPIYGGKHGTVEVIVRELDKEPVLTTQERLHLERNIQIINKVWGDDLKNAGDFKPTLMVTIVWKNVSSPEIDESKRNTFSTVILGDSEKSFIENQYNEITWIPSDYDLTIVAGLYCKNFGFQLPLSGLSNEPASWNGESNIAQAGQWLLPLYDSIHTIEESQVKEIKSLSENVWKTHGKVPCGKVDCNSFGECMDPTRDFCACKEGFEGDGLICKPKSTGGEKVKENCKSLECKGSFSTCSIINEVEQCECDLDKSFGGNEFCYPRDTKTSIKMNIEGKLTFRIGDEIIETYVKNVINYNEVQEKWSEKISVIDIPIENVSLVKFISPTLQIVNLILREPSTAKIDNIFTLFNAFSKPTKFAFTVRIETIGALKVVLLLENTEIIDGVVNINLTGSVVNATRITGEKEPFQMQESSEKTTSDLYFQLDESKELLEIKRKYLRFIKLNENKEKRIYIEGQIVSENGLSTSGFKKALETLDKNEFMFDDFQVIRSTETCIDDVCNLNIGGSEEEEPMINKEDTKEILATESPYISVVRCQATDCDSNVSDCYERDGEKSCICRESLFGGAGQCFATNSGSKVIFDMRGDVTVELSGGEYKGFSSYNIALDPIKRVTTSSGEIRSIRQEDDFTVRLLTPVIHTMNGMVATPNRKCRDGKASFEKIYNIFSLFDGFDRGMAINFDVDMERYGRVTVEFKITKLDIRANDLRYMLSGKIRRGYNFQRVTKNYEEVIGPSISSGNSYYSSYRIKGSDVVFDQSKVTFTDENKTENITVSWSATVMEPNGFRLPIMELANNDLYENALYLKYAAKSYCGTDCGAECSVHCQDEVTLLKESPGPCDCEVCPNPNEKCFEKGSGFYCDCRDGYIRNSSNDCVLRPTIGERCGLINCHVNAKCIDFVSNQCQCSPGYRGDGIVECTIDPCSRCSSSEVCRNDECVVPPPKEYCNGRYCANFATCDAKGACVCPPDMHGDPYDKCSESSILLNSELCYGHMCGENALCDEATRNCICPSGYFGLPWTSCQPNAFYTSIVDNNAGRTTENNQEGFSYEIQNGQVTVDGCAGRVCGKNAYCNSRIGTCICEDGFEGYPWIGCDPVENRCLNVVCGSNAFCDSANGHCLCNVGFNGDPYSGCSYEDNLCGGHTCGTNAICIDDVCSCPDGYTGYPYQECTLSVTKGERFCGGHTCGRNAECINDVCQCRDGFDGYPYQECTEAVPRGERCGDHECVPNATCRDNYCYCLEGYTGFGYTGCVLDDREPCDGVRCGYNAQCQEHTGVCQCNEGFEGDPNVDCVGVTAQNCFGHKCGRNAFCDRMQRQCACSEGFEGYAYDSCDYKQVVYTTPAPYGNCHGYNCGQNAECDDYARQCKCRSGFTGDPLTSCTQGAQGVRCGDFNCALNANCRDNYCYCDDGYEGFGYESCTRSTSSGSNCNGYTCHQDATCNGRECQCNSGFYGDGIYNCEREYQQGLCGGRRCDTNAYCNGVTCICNEGYTGNGEFCEYNQLCGGTTMCDANAYCSGGQCICNSGFAGDGIYCYHSSTTACSQPCGANAQCIGGVCQCNSGYSGDAYYRCDKSTSQEVSVKIEKSDSEIVLSSTQSSFSLVCWIKGDVQVFGQIWSPQTARSQENIVKFPESTRVELVVNNAKASEDATRYTCSYNGQRDDVKIRFADETGISIPLIVSSDNGISKVNHTGEASTTAKIWKLANGMKYKPLSLAFNSKTENVFFTDNNYKKIMYANTKQKIATSELIESSLPIRDIAVDSAASNVYGLTFNNTVFVVGESKPGVKYDLEGVTDKFKDTLDVEITHIVLNPEQGLMYLSVKSLKTKSAIHVFKMNGDYVGKVGDLEGHPKALSYGKVNQFGNNYGRLCTFLRMLSNDKLMTRLQCYKLSADGEKIASESNGRDFTKSDLPAGGLLQLDNMILWTVSNARSYHTLVPYQEYLVKRVCCSVRFQNIVDARTDVEVKSACSGDTSCSTVCLPTSPTKKECA